MMNPLLKTVTVLALLWLLVAPADHAVAANGSVVYTYDSLGRVHTASYDTGILILYTYDAKGNPTTQTINVNSATLTWGTGSWGASLW